MKLLNVLIWLLLFGACATLVLAKDSEAAMCVLLASMTLSVAEKSIGQARHE